MKKFEEIVGISFDKFYKKNYYKVHGYLFTLKMTYITTDDLYDATNNTMMKLLKNIEQYDITKSSITTFLCAIAKYELLLIRKIKIRRNETDMVGNTYMNVDFDFSNDLIDDSEVYDETIDEKIEAIKSFLIDYDDVFVYYIEGKSYKEIAEITNKNLIYVKNTIRKGKVKCAKHFGETLHKVISSKHRDEKLYWRLKKQKSKNDRNYRKGNE